MFSGIARDLFINGLFLSLSSLCKVTNGEAKETYALEIKKKEALEVSLLYPTL